MDTSPQGGIKLDQRFFVEFDGLRARQVRLDGWRRFVGFLLLFGHAMTHAGPTSTVLWLMLLLGAYHGINPGMGWLFAVALGMQEQKGRAVAKSLIPIAIGHGLAIGRVVADCRGAWHDAVACSHPLFRRCNPDWAWNLFLVAASAPSLGPYAGWLSRFDRLVVSYGLCPRRGLDVSAGAAG